jgi:hypothetical protein
MIRTVRNCLAIQRASQCILTTLSVVFAALACSPASTRTPCTNGGECRQIDEKYRYCLESRCVECVGSASCRDGAKCVDGMCQIID